jgi:hypothetical protein
MGYCDSPRNELPQSTYSSRRVAQGLVYASLNAGIAAVPSRKTLDSGCVFG